MSQISAPEAEDLLSKLLLERIPLRVTFASPSGTRVIMSGFLDSKTVAHGLIILASGPPIDVSRGFFNVRPFDRNCAFVYGEKREVPEEMRKNLLDSDGDTVLMMHFPDSGETVCLFFTP
jgi:hypothetical protein